MWRREQRSLKVNETYLNLLEKVLNEELSGDRTGLPKFLGHKCDFEGFPAVTTKNYNSRAWSTSYCGFLGDTNVQWLQENHVRIWDAWAKEDGSLRRSMVLNGEVGKGRTEGFMTK